MAIGLELRRDDSAMPMKAKFFATPAELRDWLEEAHLREQELWVGFYKKSSGKPSITWPEAVDALLCFGWIDGVRKSLDEISYTIRVTPRKTKSTWSAINIRRAAELSKLGLMKPAGVKAFEARTDDNSAIYSYEQRKSATLPPEFEKRFRRNKKAWKFFSAQPPGYRRLSIFRVVSAKREETRVKRLEILVRESARGRRIDYVAAPAPIRK
ncbi:MAG: YdeI/OmpD-associated family protein [Candidatus Acidiferrales bacterium]